ncbi:hypothetical protein MMC07_000708 [Pseudocyphellaria aurata]|nr:hypothetical protein [Pseudocyphellaria aurata]
MLVFLRLFQDRTACVECLDAKLGRILEEDCEARSCSRDRLDLNTKRFNTLSTFKTPGEENIAKAGESSSRKGKRPVYAHEPGESDSEPPLSRKRVISKRRVSSGKVADPRDSDDEPGVVQTSSTRKRAVVEKPSPKRKRAGAAQEETVPPCSGENLAFFMTVTVKRSSLS